MFFGTDRVSGIEMVGLLDLSSHCREGENQDIELQLRDIPFSKGMICHQS